MLYPHDPPDGRASFINLLHINKARQHAMDIT